jgi:hypothetical protein
MMSSTKDLQDKQSHGSPHTQEMGKEWMLTRQATHSGPCAWPLWGSYMGLYDSN